MTDNKHRLPIGLLNLLKLVDLVVVVSSFGLTTALIVHAQNNISLAAFLSMRTKVSNFLIFLSILYLYHLAFRMFGLYRSRRLSTRRAELADILKATTFSAACFMLLGTILSIRMLTVPFLLIFWAINTLVLCASRVAVSSCAYTYSCSRQKSSLHVDLWNESTRGCFCAEDRGKPGTRVPTSRIR